MQEVVQRQVMEQRVLVAETSSTPYFPTTPPEPTPMPEVQQGMVIVQALTKGQTLKKANPPGKLYI